MAWGGLRAQQPEQTRLAKEERTRFMEDSLLSARLNDTIALLRDSLRLMATKTYVVENYINKADAYKHPTYTTTSSDGPAFLSFGSTINVLENITTNNGHVISKSIKRVNIPNTVASSTANGLMTSADKSKLDGIASGAEVNVQADWSVTNTSSDAYIKNKPASLPTAYPKKRISYPSSMYITRFSISPGESVFYDVHSDVSVTLKYPSEDELNHNNVARICIAQGGMVHYSVENGNMMIFEANDSKYCEGECMILHEIHWINRNTVMIKHQVF